MEIVTKSAEESQEFGRKIGATLRGGEIIALIGDLGSGKTTFVQGLAKGLGVKSAILSPTYIIMRTYSFKHLKDSHAKKLYHVDLYRIKDNVDLEAENLGMPNLWGRSENIFVIEWADKLSLPLNTRHITVQNTGHSSRKFII